MFWFLISTNAIANGVNIGKASSKQTALYRRTGAETYTDVVNNVFCESNPSIVGEAEDNLEKVHSYAELRYDRGVSLPDSFTVCSTIMTTACPAKGHDLVFFNILSDNRDQLMSPWVDHGSGIESKAGINFQDSYHHVNGAVPPVFPNQWTRSCVAINAKTGLIHFVVEGTLVMTRNLDEVMDPRKLPKNLTKRLILGTSSYGEDWYAQSNKVTNVNIFSSALPIQKMISITRNGGCVEEGDYLAWGDMEWILHGQARAEKVEIEELSGVGPNIYYTPFPSMDACMFHCEKLHTRAPSVTTFEEWKELQKLLKTNRYKKGQIWLPITDRDEEGRWTDFYNGKAIQNYTIPWLGSKPDGGEAENCACLWDANKWADNGCTFSEYACMCSYRPSTTVKLRGLCTHSEIDVYYKPMNEWDHSRTLILQGLRQTSIVYDDEEKMWVLHVANLNVTGFSKARHHSFTLGKQNWTLIGDKQCNEGDSYSTELKMSGCQKDEFTCNDGQCVSMDVRCDQLPDCRDKSDERGCSILVLEEGYNSNVPPVNSRYPLNVSVSLHLLKLVDINEDDYSIEIQFEITLEWKEIRATYHNLKEATVLNALTQKDTKRLWLPQVIYENTDQKETTRLGEFGNGEWDTKIVVRREEENGTMSRQDMLDETMIFDGSKNSLLMTQTYTHTFQCPYELSTYPFDTQVAKDV